MISRTMGVATAGTVRSVRAAEARSALSSRLLALVLDLISYGILSLVVNGVYGSVQVTSGSVPVGAGFSQYTTAIAVAWPFQVLLALAYFTLPEALFGATPGKLLMRICVVEIDGEPLTIHAVLIRNVLRIVDWLPFLYVLGGAMTLFSENSQRLGDLVAGTTVISRADAARLGGTRTAGPRARRLAAILLVAAVLITIAFEYFARPAILVEGLYNQRQMPIRGNGYTLGTPVWSLGRVTYPITGQQGGSTASCIGAITLEWSWFGWQDAGSYYACNN
jgi:uncharacterized RDD family membrane protein YckC